MSEHAADSWPAGGPLARPHTESRRRPADVANRGGVFSSHAHEPSALPHPFLRMLTPESVVQAPGRCLSCSRLRWTRACMRRWPARALQTPVPDHHASQPRRPRPLVSRRAVTRGADTCMLKEKVRSATRYRNASRSCMIMHMHMSCPA